MAGPAEFGHHSGLNHEDHEGNEGRKLLNPRDLRDLRDLRGLKKEESMGRLLVLVAAVAGLALLVSSAPGAQRAPVDLYPVLEKLSQGKAFVGVNPGDLSL